MNDFTIPRDRGYLMKRIGDLSQIAGVRRYTLSDGRAAGVDAADVETGAGLSFTKRILGSGGGYVFAPSHNFQSDMPPENTIAMYAAGSRLNSL
jgi:hypothetical protein